MAATLADECIWEYPNKVAIRGDTVYTKATKAPVTIVNTVIVGTMNTEFGLNASHKNCDPTLHVDVVTLLFVLTVIVVGNTVVGMVVVGGNVVGVVVVEACVVGVAVTGTVVTVCVVGVVVVGATLV
jgi:hypothetical protein